MKGYVRIVEDRRQDILPCSAFERRVLVESTGLFELELGTVQGDLLRIRHCQLIDVVIIWRWEAKLSGLVVVVWRTPFAQILSHGWLLLDDRPTNHAVT